MLYPTLPDSCNIYPGFNLPGLLASFSNSWLLGGLNFLIIFKVDRLIGGSLNNVGRSFKRISLVYITG